MLPVSETKAIANLALIAKASVSGLTTPNPPYFLGAIFFLLDALLPQDGEPCVIFPQEAFDGLWKLLPVDLGHIQHLEAKQY